MDTVTINGVPLDRDALRANAEKYLDSMHVTLWADWIIGQPDSREKAKDWLAKTVLEFAEFVPPSTNGNGNGKRKET